MENKTCPFNGDEIYVARNGQHMRFLGECPPDSQYVFIFKSLGDVKQIYYWFNGKSVISRDWDIMGTVDQVHNQEIQERIDWLQSVADRKIREAILGSGAIKNEVLRLQAMQIVRVIEILREDLR